MGAVDEEALAFCITVQSCGLIASARSCSFYKYVLSHMLIITRLSCRTPGGAAVCDLLSQSAQFFIPQT